MLRTLPALLLLLAACSTPVATPPPATSPGSQPSPSTGTIPFGSPSPTATPLPATPRFTLHCNLPVETMAGGSGFLTFPGGEFTAAGTPPASIPEIGGYYPQTYDWAFS